MYLKRWVLLLLVGLIVLSLGLAYFFVEAYRTVALPDLASIVTLQFLPRPLRGLLFVLAGGLIVAIAVWKLNASVLDAFRPQGGTNLVDAIWSYRSRQRGPKVVCIGGGTGMPAVLRGLKRYTSNITAVVTVADDGGSSGRLRRELGILPPGDFRNCIVALAEAEPLVARLFQYRFGPGSGLEGHSFGNLFVVAMSGVTGNFEEAIRETSRVLAVRGRVLPSTLENLTLWAELDGQDTVEGESNIGKSNRPIKQVHVRPERPAAYPEAVRAILEADLIVVGPGSLFTSVVPNLLVDGIAKALVAADALTIYVCNVATQPGETDGFTAADHVTALLNHLQENPFDHVLVNNNVVAQTRSELGVALVQPREAPREIAGIRVVLADLVDDAHPLRHDPEKLAQVLLRLYYERTAAARAPRPTSTVALSS
ncbi:MAG: YvcK family protein [Chloroflexi bacterium]|nr:YvcK family protein [Chloroflexota bacterium]